MHPCDHVYRYAEWRRGISDQTGAFMYPYSYGPRLSGSKLGSGGKSYSVFSISVSADVTSPFGDVSPAISQQ